MSNDASAVHGLPLADSGSDLETMDRRHGFSRDDLLAKARCIDLGVVKPVADDVGGVFDFTAVQVRRTQKRGERM